MKVDLDAHGPEHLESVGLYALRALPAQDLPAVEAQFAACADCRRELEALRRVLDRLASWPGAGMLRPSPSLWDRLARRLSDDTGAPPAAEPPPTPEPPWEEALPGVTYRVLATDPASDRLTLLLALAPGAEYPPHVHAGIEELYLLEGELLVNGKKLQAGDYLRSEPGTADHQVWSETGCTGVLITSAGDLFR